MNDPTYSEKQSERNAILDIWIHFLLSLKDKDIDQIRELIGELDTYFGIRTAAYQGPLLHPKTNESKGSFSMVLENNIPRHVGLTAAIEFKI